MKDCLRLCGMHLKYLFKILIEQWRRDYNQIRPHKTSNHCPPAPVNLNHGDDREVVKLWGQVTGKSVILRGDKNGFQVDRRTTDAQKYGT
jgi:hypothetical protein